MYVMSLTPTLLHPNPRLRLQVQRLPPDVGHEESEPVAMNELSLQSVSEMSEGSVGARTHPIAATGAGAGTGAGRRIRETGKSI